MMPTDTKIDPIDAQNGVDQTEDIIWFNSYLYSRFMSVSLFDWGASRAFWSRRWKKWRREEKKWRRRRSGWTEYLKLEKLGHFNKGSKYNLELQIFYVRQRVHIFQALNWGSSMSLSLIMLVEIVSVLESGCRNQESIIKP